MRKGIQQMEHFWKIRFNKNACLFKENENLFTDKSFRNFSVFHQYTSIIFWWSTEIVRNIRRNNGEPSDKSTTVEVLIKCIKPKWNTYGRSKARKKRSITKYMYKLACYITDAECLQIIFMQQWYNLFWEKGTLVHVTLYLLQTKPPTPTLLDLS